MTCTFNDCISKSESEIQKVLYETAMLQSKMADIDIKQRSKFNTVLEKQMAKYQVQRAKYQSLEVAINILCVVTSILAGVLIVSAPVLGVIAGIGATALEGAEALQTALGLILQTVIPIVVNLAEGGGVLSLGILQIISGSYRNQMACTKGDINTITALSQYISDKDDDNSSKMKNTYSALTDLMKTFNQLIGLYGQAVQKVN